MVDEFEAWRELMLREVERQNSCLERLQEETTNLRVGLGKLGAIAALVGAIAATVVSVVAQIII